MKRTVNTLVIAAIAAAFAVPAVAGSETSSAGASRQGGNPAQSMQGSSWQLTPAQQFDVLDSNNDNYVSRSEAGLAPDIVVIFPVADTDKDDRLSQSEHEQSMKKNAQASSAGASRDVNRTGDEGVHSPRGPIGGDPLGTAGRSGSGSGSAGGR